MPCPSVLKVSFEISYNKHVLFNMQHLGSAWRQILIFSYTEGSLFSAVVSNREIIVLKPSPHFLCSALLECRETFNPFTSSEETPVNHLLLNDSEPVIDALSLTGRLVRKVISMSLSQFISLGAIMATVSLQNIINTFLTCSNVHVLPPFHKLQIN